MPLQHEAADFLCLDAGRSGFRLLPNGSDKAAPVVPQLVAEVARLSSEAVVLRSGRSCLTYRELDARAGRLAGRLRSLGVGRDVPVGVRLERSFEQVTTLLAVMKAGGAFLPLDPAWPDERVRELLDDAGAPVLIEDPARGSGARGRVVVTPDAGGGAAETREAAADIRGEDLAYVVYTSGSTAGLFSSLTSAGRRRAGGRG